MILVQHAWPEACLARAAAAKLVADLLGQDHDIALLDGMLAGPDGQVLSAADRRALLRHCKARHDELRAEAMPKAQLLFVEKSDQLGARIQSLWEAAQRADRTRSHAADKNEVPAVRRSS